MTWKLNGAVATLLLISACASARPTDSAGSTDGAMDTLRRARALHWSVQLYVADSVHAEGRALRLGSTSAVVGGEEVAYAAIDSIYRWSPEVTVVSKTAAVTGATILGGLGVLMALGLCTDDQASCALFLGGGGATIGAFLGAAAGGLLSPSEGAWVPLWAT